MKSLKLTPEEMQMFQQSWRIWSYVFGFIGLILGIAYKLGFVALPATATDIQALERSLVTLEDRVHTVGNDLAGSNIGQISNTVKTNKKTLDENRRDIKNIKDSVHQLKIDDEVNKAERRSTNRQLLDIKDAVNRILNKL